MSLGVWGPVTWGIQDSSAQSAEHWKWCKKPRQTAAPMGVRSCYFCRNSHVANPRKAFPSNTGNPLTPLSGAGSQNIKSRMDKNTFLIFGTQWISGGIGYLMYLELLTTWSIVNRDMKTSRCSASIRTPAPAFARHPTSEVRAGKQ